MARHEIVHEPRPQGPGGKLSCEIGQIASTKPSKDGGLIQICRTPDPTGPSTPQSPRKTSNYGFGGGDALEYIKDLQNYGFSYQVTRSTPHPYIQLGKKTYFLYVLDQAMRDIGSESSLFGGLSVSEIKSIMEEGAAYKSTSGDIELNIPTAEETIELLKHMAKSFSMFNVQRSQTM